MPVLRHISAPGYVPTNITHWQSHRPGTCHCPMCKTRLDATQPHPPSCTCAMCKVAIKLNATLSHNCTKHVTGLTRRLEEGEVVNDPYKNGKLGLSRDAFIILVAMIVLASFCIIFLLFRWLDKYKGVFDPKRRYSKDGYSSFMGQVRRFRDERTAAFVAAQTLH